MLRVILLVVLIGVIHLGCGSASANPKKTADKQIADLITELSSKNYKVREQATLHIKELDEAVPALREALKGADLETRRRLEAIIRAIDARLGERFIKEAVARVNEEGIDLFLDRMVLEKGFAEKRWPALLKLASALGKRAVAVGGTAPKCLDQDYVNLPVITTCENNGFSKRLLVDGVKHRVNALHGCLLISSGPIKSVNSTDNSILFVNGDIGQLNSTRNSIVFCNGTIKGFNSTVNCLIFCNGLVESMNHTEGNTIFVRGELRSLNFTKNSVIEATQLGQGGLSQGNTYLNRPLPPESMGDQVAKADPSPLTLFQYFDPIRDGLAFSMLDGDVRVDALTESKPYARAGLKKGDLVLAVNRHKFMSRDAFVGLLRRQVLMGEALLKVQRDDRVLQMGVRFQP